MPPTNSTHHQTLEEIGSGPLEMSSDREARYAKDRYGKFWGSFLNIFSNSIIERLVEFEHEALRGTDEDLKALPRYPIRIHARIFTRRGEGEV